jgi:chromosome partitioning protein
MIIGVLNQKGGVGKITIAVNLAAVYAASGKRTLLVDADPQGSALAWSVAREGDPVFTVIGMPKPTLIFANKMGGRRFIVTLWHRPAIFSR